MQIFTLFALLIALCHHQCLVSATVYSSLMRTYQASNFFDGFDFFTDGDPTGGTVQFVDRSTAQLTGLIKSPTSDTGAVYMSADATEVVTSGGRKSVRIVSKDTYLHGLIVLDLDHIPYGCGTWPAFWTVGPNWPDGGELDIIERVNAVDYDNIALHTSDNCTISGTGGAGTLVTENCYIYAPDQSYNAGCAWNSHDARAYGATFAAHGGGVYVTEWTSDAIKVWFFARDEMPPDVNTPEQDTTSWGPPVANFDNCDIDSHMAPQQLVFDLTFCGAWGGDANVWAQTCSEHGPSCSDYVINNPAAFDNAYWSINSLKIWSL